MKRVRSQFKYNDEQTNVGHIVAAEYNNYYQKGTEIKVLVHPLVKGSSIGGLITANRNSASDSGIEMSTAEISADQNGINNEKGQIEGYGPPVVFTCDSKQSNDFINLHFSHRKKFHFNSISIFQFIRRLNT